MRPPKHCKPVSQTNRGLFDRGEGRGCFRHFRWGDVIPIDATTAIQRGEISWDRESFVLRRDQSKIFARVLTVVTIASSCATQEIPFFFRQKTDPLPADWVTSCRYYVNHSNYTIVELGRYHRRHRAGSTRRDDGTREKTVPLRIEKSQAPQTRYPEKLNMDMKEKTWKQI
jgi:hypothetical protein